MSSCFSVPPVCFALQCFPFLPSPVFSLPHLFISLSVYSLCSPSCLCQFDLPPSSSAFLRVRLCRNSVFPVVSSPVSPGVTLLVCGPLRFSFLFFVFLFFSILTCYCFLLIIWFVFATILLKVPAFSLHQNIFPGSRSFSSKITVKCENSAYCSVMYWHTGSGTAFHVAAVWPTLLLSLLPSSIHFCRMACANI